MCFATSTLRLHQDLQNRKQLDVEHQHAVRRNAADALGTVSQFTRHIEAPFTANAHQLQRLGPASGHTANRELGRLAALVGAVEHSAVDQGAVVVSTYLSVETRLGAVTGSQHFVLQPRSQGGNAFTLGVFSNESFTFTGSCFGFTSEGHTSELQSRENIVCL